MDAAYTEFWTTEDDTREVEGEAERAYWERLRMADEYADYVERMAVAMAEEGEEEDGGDELPTPPAAPALVGQGPARPLWAVLLAESAGRCAATNAERRAARRQRRAELDRAA